MRRHGLTAVLLLVALSSFAQADLRFAQEELDHYSKPLYPGNRLDAVLAVDPALGGGGEAFSISVEKNQLNITGTNENMALQGTYYVLDQLGYRFLSPNFKNHPGAPEFIPKK